MEQKTKVGIIVVILILLILGGIMVITGKKTTTQSQNPTAQVQVPTDIVSAPTPAAKEDTRTYQEKEPNMKTVAVDGKVTTVSATSIEIINGETKNTFPITDKVLVASINPKSAGNKRIADIKKDDAVTIVLNAANSEVVGIQIN
jgi:hypothetical protein